jgi:hypothetical protein
MVFAQWEEPAGKEPTLKNQTDGRGPSGVPGILKRSIALLNTGCIVLSRDILM